MSYWLKEVHWWPPRITNGIVDKYLLEYQVTDATMSPEPGIHNATGDCNCPKLHTESSLPTPHVTNYYNKEQLLYRDSVMNFMFVKRKDPPRAKRNATQEARFEEIYRRFEVEREERAKRIQNAEEESYQITHRLPVCKQPNPSTQYQIENKCVPLETHKDAIEIKGDRHFYVITQLKPETTYRISVRACVKDLDNGCGAERVIFAETVSKRLEKLIETLGFKHFNW